jgi:flagellar motor protein MotB
MSQNGTKQRTASTQIRYRSIPRRRTVPNTSSWMITFGDLITLLLCFFLALVSTGAYQLGNRHLPDTDHGPVFAQTGKEVLKPSKNRLSLPHLFISEADLMKREVMFRRLAEMSSLNATGKVLLIESCRGDDNEIVESDFRQINAASTGLPFVRRFGFREEPCTSGTEGRSVAVISIIEEQN